MVYIKTNWQPGEAGGTMVTADRLNNLETQYDEAKEYADAGLATKVGSEYVDEKIASTVAAGVSPVEGVRLYSYGHSYTSVPNPHCTPNGGEYGYRVGRRIQSSESLLRGRSGTPAQDTFCMALANEYNDSSGIVRLWTPGSRGIVLLENYMNEMGRTDGSGADPKFRDQWKRAIRGLLALFSAGQIITAGSGTRTGAWTKHNSTNNAEGWAGADCYFANTVGAEISFSVTGDEVWVIAAASAASQTLGSFQARVGATVLQTISANGINAEYESVVVTRNTGRYPCAFKITGLNAAAGTSGTKTITFRVTTAANVFINGVMIPSTTPPQIFVGKEPSKPPASPGYATYIANRPYYDAEIESLTAEFPNAHLVDLDADWNYNTMVSSLDTVAKHHPNDLGMMHIASRFTEAIFEECADPINGVLTL